MIALTDHERHPSTLNQNLNATLIIQSNQLVSSLIAIYSNPINMNQYLNAWVYFINLLPNLDPLFSSLNLPFFRLRFQSVPSCIVESICCLWEKKEIVKGKKG